MPQLTSSFFRNLVDELRKLNGDSEPLWGSMSPQHMVEHLVSSWRISNGRASAPLLSDEAYREKANKFLYSDLPFEKNIQNPIHAKGLPPLRKDSLKAAIDQLADEIEAFFVFWETKDKHTETHPVFGELDEDGWLTFQKKHMSHHLEQFDLPV